MIGRVVGDLSHFFSQGFKFRPSAGFVVPGGFRV